jgi:hypothetical protein
MLNVYLNAEKKRPVFGFLVFRKVHLRFRHVIRLRPFAP